MVIIDGKETAMEIKQEIAKEVKRMMAAGEKQPHLAAILVGHDGGSETYVANKVKACDECGFKSTLIRFEDDITEDELLQAIDKLNHNDDVDGFIVQLPLPRHIDEQKVIEAIDYKKDVDGFHPINVGQHVNRIALLPLRHSTRHFGTARTLWYRNQRQALRGAGQKQHRGQTSGANATPERQSGQLHRDRVPQRHRRPATPMPPCRHSYRSYRSTSFREGRHGEKGCRGD